MKTELTARNEDKQDASTYLIYTIKSDRSIKDQSKYERENK